MGPPLRLGARPRLSLEPPHDGLCARARVAFGAGVLALVALVARLAVAAALLLHTAIGRALAYVAWRACGKRRLSSRAMKVFFAMLLCCGALLLTPLWLSLVGAPALISAAQGPVIVTLVTPEQFGVELRTLIGSAHAHFPRGTVAVYGVGLSRGQQSELALVSRVQYVELHSPASWAAVGSIWQQQDALMRLKHEVLAAAQRSYGRFSFVDVNAYFTGRSVTPSGDAPGGGVAAYVPAARQHAVGSFVYQESCSPQAMFNGSHPSTGIVCVEIGPNAPYKVDVEWQFAPSSPQMLTDMRCLLRMYSPRPRRAARDSPAAALRSVAGGGAAAPFQSTAQLAVSALRALPAAEEPAPLFDDKQKVCVCLTSPALGGAFSAGAGAVSSAGDTVAGLAAQLRPLLESLRGASLAASASGRFAYSLYVGSAQHPVLDNSTLRAELARSFDETLGSAPLAITVVRLPLSPALEPHLVAASNAAVSVAHADGCHYFLRLFDAVAVSSDWAGSFAAALQRSNNLGVIVPAREGWRGGAAVSPSAFGVSGVVDSTVVGDGQRTGVDAGQHYAGGYPGVGGGYVYGGAGQSPGGSGGDGSAASAGDEGGGDAARSVAPTSEGDLVYAGRGPGGMPGSPRPVAAFAARRHVDMLGAFDSPALFYWFADDFLAALYGPSYTYALLPSHGKLLATAPAAFAGAPSSTHCHVHACLVQPELRAARNRIVDWLRRLKPDERTALQTMQALLAKCRPGTYACQRALDAPLEC